ncbi:MAG: hypothetical protein CFE24_11705 [Flavobacterium sp. BFFFF2]|nr:MAG: hypothetical protein CFE24_11705 [Flavobacterium sp. BFFFF2]
MGSKPTETTIEFILDEPRPINHKRLKRILERDIKNVKNFSVVIQGNKIAIHIEYNRIKALFDYDFEFCVN